MHRLRVASLCLTNLLVCRLLSAAPDPASLTSELRHIETQLDQGQSSEVLGALPSVWSVSAGGAEYTISTEPLRKLLESPAGRDGRSQQAKLWLEHLAAHLETSSTPLPAAAKARGELGRILQRPEFASMAPPSQWDRLRERIATWFAQLFARIFEAVASHPTESEVFFWVLLGGAVLSLGWWLLRRWSREEQLSLKIPGIAPPRTPDQWLLAAKAASEKRDFRKAIQCAYWAGVTRLEERGALPRNRAQTPRECLHLIAAPRVGVISPFAEPLAMLTNRLERFWYAGLSASAEDFSACLGALEALGCRLD